MIPAIDNLEDMKGKTINEWVRMEGPRQKIKQEFKSFLLSFVDEQGNSVFGPQIKSMCERFFILI